MPDKLVIFDCDGVLVDSEPIAARVFAEALAEQGWSLSEEEVDRRFRGRSLPDCVRLAEEELGRELPRDFIPQLHERTLAAFSEKLEPVAHVREALEALRDSGVRLCVASSGSHEKMRFTLGRTGLLEFFEPHLFSALEVENGKPAPDLFLYAARRRETSPANATVVEDSVPGVRGARAAGMRVLGYAGAGGAQELEEAGAEVFCSMRELPALLGFDSAGPDSTSPDSAGPDSAKKATEWDLPDDAELDRAVRLLEEGQVVGLPTETVYGLAADALSPEAVARIFEVKGRPKNHPLILHLADEGWLDEYALDVPSAAHQLARAFWPGPLTILLRKSEKVPLEATGGLPTVALRVPGHPVARALLERFGRPLAAPSANRFGAVSPTTREHVLQDLGDDVPLVLEGGSCEVGLESTIVDFSRGAPRLLRPGGISRERIEALLGLELLEPDGSERAPGTLASHYAPRAPVQLLDRARLWQEVERRSEDGARLGVICQEEPPDPLPEHVVVIRLPEDPSLAARELYGSLRDLDERGCEQIVTTLPPEDGVGAAIADRLRRAAAPRS